LTPFPKIFLLHPKKSTLPESEGEEFSDISSDGSDTNENEEPAKDAWVFPVIGPQAKWVEYDAVCGQTSSRTLNEEYLILGTQRSATQGW
jgi:hypothetical protein